MKQRSLLAVLLCTLQAFTSVTAHTPSESPSIPTKDFKVLVLIIASDEVPVYCELQKIWRAYMHYDHKHVVSYFIKANPALPQECIIDGDVIWARCQENQIPGIMNKTILALEAFLPRIGTEFDYVLRTNLSSFIVFSRLLDYLKACPRTNFYGGSHIGADLDPNITVGSGSCFILSPDVAATLVRYKTHFFNNTLCDDDVMIGLFLRARGIKLVVSERCNILSPQAWQEKKDALPEDVFQFRVKNPGPMRLEHDVAIQKHLLSIFYPEIQCS